MANESNLLYVCTVPYHHSVNVLTRALMQQNHLVVILLAICANFIRLVLFELLQQETEVKLVFTQNNNLKLSQIQRKTRPPTFLPCFL